MNNSMNNLMNNSLLEFSYRENLSYLEGKLVECILSHKLDPSEKNKDILKEALSWVAPDRLPPKPILGPGVLYRQQIVKESLPVLGPDYGPWVLWKQGDTLPPAKQKITVYMQDADPNENCAGTAVSFNWDRVSAYCVKK